MPLTATEIDQVAHALAQTAREDIARAFPTGGCITSTRVQLDVLGAYRIPAQQG
jgi:hypothetical protein